MDVESLLRTLRRAGEAPLGSGIDAAAILGGSADASRLLDAFARRSLNASVGAIASPAAWLEKFYADARAVDRRAFEILAFRFEGLSDSEVAERLGGGAGLVRRILADLRGIASSC